MIGKHGDSDSQTKYVSYMLWFPQGLLLTGAYILIYDLL